MSCWVAQGQGQYMHPRWSTGSGAPVGRQGGSTQTRADHTLKSAAWATMTCPLRSPVLPTIPLSLPLLTRQPSALGQPLLTHPPSLPSRPPPTYLLPLLQRITQVPPWHDAPAGRRWVTGTHPPGQASNAALPSQAHGKGRACITLGRLPGEPAGHPAQLPAAG
jgi:hypothetical protein